LRSALTEFSTQFPDIPILAMASDPDHAFAVELVKLGVSAYFIVPDEQRKISQQIAVLFNDWSRKSKKKSWPSFSSKNTISGISSAIRRRSRLRSNAHKRSSRIAP